MGHCSKSRKDIQLTKVSYHGFVEVANSQDVATESLSRLSTRKRDLEMEAPENPVSFDGRFPLGDNCATK